MAIVAVFIAATNPAPPALLATSQPASSALHSHAFTAPVEQASEEQPLFALWPLLLYTGAVAITVGGMLGLSALLGQRHMGRETGEPYESGIRTTSSARLRFSVQFYLVAILFVIFDLEAVFIIAWALAFREAGWIGYLGMLFFISVLLIGLVYEWRQGSLDWGSTGNSRRST
jgi:NADH-quinone oxidoreductase subunit A